jgi:hypothetical protein
MAMAKRTSSGVQTCSKRHSESRWLSEVTGNGLNVRSPARAANSPFITASEPDSLPIQLLPHTVYCKALPLLPLYGVVLGHGDKLTIYLISILFQVWGRGAIAPRILALAADIGRDLHPPAPLTLM